MRQILLLIEACEGDTVESSSLTTYAERHLRIKRDVPRGGAVARGDERRIARRRFPAGRVEAKHEDPIEPPIRHGDKPAAWIENCFARMQARLSDAIQAGITLQGDQICAWPQGSVLLDRHDAHRAGAVIRGDDPATGPLDRQVHRPPSTADYPTNGRFGA